MADLDWKAWLQERFVGYLRYDAAGGPRDPEQVARALEQLTGTPGAWSKLAQLGFLLDPAGETERFVIESVPKWLGRIYPITDRRIEASRGRVRGKVDWPRTFRTRLQTQDPTWFVGSAPERTFKTPATIVVRWLLEQVLRAIGDLGPRDLSIDRGWVRPLSKMHAATSEALRHAALRTTPVRRPEATERQHCAQSKEPTLHQAARLLSFHDELLPNPQGPALQRTVERFALAPTTEPRRFELFTLLAVLDALDSLLPGWKRIDELIHPGATWVASWKGPGGAVRVSYDKGTPAGVHADVMHHYLGAEASVRPDIRLEFETPTSRQELYLDAKCSPKPSYLVSSHLKMLSYIADRPGAFGPQGPKVIITTPLEITAAIRPGDSVVFLGPTGCTGGRLAEALGMWLGLPETISVEV